MKIYLLGAFNFSVGVTTMKAAEAATKELEQEGNDVVNSYATTIFFKDAHENLFSCIDKLIQAEAVYIMSDWRDTSKAELLFAIAAELGLIIYPAPGVIIPPKILINISI